MHGASSRVPPDTFRRVLGQFPTGVAVVTAMRRDGQPVGMAVGSFTSVSLEPPLVGFLPAVTSKTWPEIEAYGGFCVNILSAEQESLCRTFSRSGADKFADVAWRPSPNGAPILEDGLAWIDCGLERVDPAGDHYFVLGAVQDLAVQADSGPLVFFRGGYGVFQSGSLVAGDPQGDLAVPLRIVDLARPELERLVKRSNTQCAVTALVGDQVVVLAVVGGVGSRSSSTFIGGRNRLVPPVGATFMAWEPEERVDAWMALGRDRGESDEALLARLDTMKRRGFAVSLEGGGIHEWEEAMSTAAEDGPQRRQLLSRVAQTFDARFEKTESRRIRNLHVPVFGPDGRVGVVLNVGDFPPLDSRRLAGLISDVRFVADNIAQQLVRADPGAEA
jgi:flavin reductase (DIM6/NTAB) family NADH-FMN oxidoreductase RutF